MGRGDLVTVRQDDLALVLACFTTEQLSFVSGLREAVKRLSRAVPLPER